MGHTKESVTKAVGEFLNTGKIAELYGQNCINRTGYIPDSDDEYTEVIAEHLLGHVGMLEKIPRAIRRGKYNVKRTGTTSRPSDGRKGEKTEDRDAMRIYNQKTLPPLGEIIHYQTPLKNGRNSAIDLLSYDGENVYILELKRRDSKETLLRCVLEAYTYSRMVDFRKLLNEENFKLPADTNLRKAALVYEGSQAHKDLNGVNIKRLMSVLAVDLFVLDKSGEKIIETHYCENLEG